MTDHVLIRITRRNRIPVGHRWLCSCGLSGRWYFIRDHRNPERAARVGFNRHAAAMQAAATRRAMRAPTAEPRIEEHW